MMAAEMSERQELTFNGAIAGTSLRGTLDRPSDHAQGRRAAVVLHRGIVTSDADNDFLEALGVALADAGVLALRFEPRTAGLILDDFHAFSLTDDRDDLLNAMQTMAARDDVDAGRIGLIGWSLGAISACAAVASHPSLERLSLINPATPSFVVTRLQRSNGSPAPLQPEQVPRAFAQQLEGADSARDAAMRAQPTLIVHAAADRMIPPAISLEYLNALEKANRPVERVLIARADHAFSVPAVRQGCIDRVVRFFAQSASSKRPATAVGAGA
jgi:dienelactone hydrolase